MTIGTVVTAVVMWIGERSVWWLLVLVPAFWVLRDWWRDLDFKLWRRDMRKRMSELEQEIAVCKNMGDDADAIAWREWQHAALKELLHDPNVVLLNETPDKATREFYERRNRALVDAYYLAKDRAFVSSRKVALAQDPDFIAKRKQLLQLHIESH